MFFHDPISLVDNKVKIIPMFHIMCEIDMEA